MAGKLSKKPHSVGEKLSVRMRGAAHFFAGHGVAGKKAGLMGTSVKWPRTLGNGNFDATYVGHQLMRLELRRKPLQPILNGRHRPAQKHQVAGDRCADWIGGGYIDCSAVQSYLQMGGATVPADDLAGELRGAQSKAGGSADEDRKSVV